MRPFVHLPDHFTHQARNRFRGGVKAAMVSSAEPPAEGYILKLSVVLSLRGALRQACPERSRRAQDKLRDEAISFGVSVQRCHCEERSDEAISTVDGHCALEIASLRSQ